MEKIKKSIEQKLNNEGLSINVIAREKHVYGLYKNAKEVMQHIVTKFVIKVLAFAYFMFVWKYKLFFFSKLRKICRERINKIKLAGRLTNEANATPKPKRENPIAHQKFADEA